MVAISDPSDLEKSQLLKVSTTFSREKKPERLKRDARSYHNHKAKCFDAV